MLTYEQYLIIEQRHEECVRRVERMSSNDKDFARLSEIARNSFKELEQVRLTHTEFYLRRCAEPS